MLVYGTSAGYRVRIKEGPPVHHQRPSVDVLFYSVARSAGKHALGILLTGMGKDGAQGLLEIRNSGGDTISQDEKSSVVYGMPREAALIGAANHVAPLESIPQTIINSITRSNT